MKSFSKKDTQIFIIENEQDDTSYTYEQDEFDKIIPVQFVRDYYDYKVGEHEVELSRENKKQLLIGPAIKFEYYNQSGKSVCHVRSSA